MLEEDDDNMITKGNRTRLRSVSDPKNTLMAVQVHVYMVIIVVIVIIVVVIVLDY